MYNVLLVDDDPMILEGLQYIVDWQGIGLQIAGAVEDGEDALHILRSAHIDILLTDIRMPRVNGLELIEWIRNNQQPVCCIVLSGHDDYEYLHRAFKLGIENYLVKSVNENELQETLLSIVDKLDATGRGMPNTTEDPLLVNVLERWMLGRIRYSEFLERSRLLAFPAFPCRFRISVFRPLVSGVCASARNCKAVTSSFLKMNDIFLQSFVNLDGEIVVIQGNQSAPNLPDLNAIIAELCSMDDFRWVCSSSRSQVGFENASISYRSAHRLLDYALPCPNFSVFLEDQLPASPQLQRLETDPLRRFLETSSLAALRAHLRQVLQRAYRPDEISPEAFLDYSFNVVILLSEYAVAHNVHLKSISTSKSQLYDELKALRSTNEMIALLDKLILELSGRIGEDKNTGTPLTDRLLQYVSLHYREELSLKQLSALFNCNSAYLGRLFKDSTGESFNQYLNRFRTREACRLLTSTNKRMNQIAEQVGYASTNYFVTTFKRFVGCYPTRYRTLHQGQEQIEGDNPFI